MWSNSTTPAAARTNSPRTRPADPAAWAETTEKSTIWWPSLKASRGDEILIDEPELPEMQPLPRSRQLNEEEPEMTNLDPRIVAAINGENGEAEKAGTRNCLMNRRSSC